MEFSIKAIERREAKGAESSLESPHSAGTWHLEAILRMFGMRKEPKEGRYFASPDLCQYDMKEPGKDDVY